MCSSASDERHVPIEVLSPPVVDRRGAGVSVARVDLLSTRRGAGRVSVFEAVAVSGAADRGEKVAESLVSASGIAGCIEVHEEASDDGEHDGGQLRSAEPARA
jgi:hypothetical protein